MKIIHPVEMGAITGLYGGIGGDAKLVAGKVGSNIRAQVSALIV